jgi:hypothetical protein
MQINGDHDYAFRFSDGTNGYYFGDIGYGRYDSSGNGYYIYDTNGNPGGPIGETTNGETIYEER